MRQLLRMNLCKRVDHIVKSGSKRNLNYLDERVTGRMVPNYLPEMNIESKTIAPKRTQRFARDAEGRMSLCIGPTHHTLEKPR